MKKFSTPEVAQRFYPELLGETEKGKSVRKREAKGESKGL